MDKETKIVTEEVTDVQDVKKKVDVKTIVAGCILVVLIVIAVIATL